MAVVFVFLPFCRFGYVRNGHVNCRPHLQRIVKKKHINEHGIIGGSNLL